MKVKIEKVIKETSPCIVFFSTEYGTAKGIWSSGIPSIGSEYFVEFDISMELSWGKNIIYDSNNKCLVDMDNDNVYISGILESIDDDGFSVLRLGSSTIMFVADGCPYEPGKYIKLIVDSMELYDYEL